MDAQLAATSLDKAQQDLVQKQLSLRSLRNRLAGAKDKDKELRKACQGFESIFINKLWKQMRSTVPKGFLHSKEEDFYLSMFDQELAKKLSEDGGIGLGDELYSQLKEQLARSSSKTIPNGERAPMALHHAVRPLRPAAAPAAPKAAPEPEFDGSAAAMYSDVTVLDGQGEGPAGQGGTPGPGAAAAAYAARARLAGNKVDQSRLAPMLARVRQEEAVRAQRAAAQGVAESAVSTDDAAAADPGADFALEPSAADPAGADPLSGLSSGGLSSGGLSGAVDSDAARTSGPVSQREIQGRVNALAASILRNEGPVNGRGGPAPAPRPDVAARLREAVSLGGGPSYSVPLSWPTQGDVSSAFGWRKDPFTGERAFHAGVDILADQGDSVRACWDGTVVEAGPHAGYGNLVVLEHANGWKSYYGHNSELDVQVGDTVRAGRKIAEVGSSGRSTGAHLHFELRQGDQAWDPEMIQQRLLAGLPIGRSNQRG
ncbi:MAG: peptidoglycan DD-metalloendopeptidase family protein [Desulfovibrionaceae bacterium]|nr:peptidoglycan DD-metalloendopeptidase family protein [Desulfovibrionaceae bacterium]